MECNGKESIQHEDRIRLFVEGDRNLEPESANNMNEELLTNEPRDVTEMVAQNAQWQTGSRNESQSKIWITPKDVKTTADVKKAAKQKDTSTGKERIRSKDCEQAVEQDPEPLDCSKDQTRT